MATFNHLPAELLIHIQRAVDSPRDLHSLISASPDCLRTFLPNRIRTLASVLKNAIPEGALRHALAFCYLPSPLPTPLPDGLLTSQERDTILIPAIEPFLQRYFSDADEPFDVPMDITSLTFLFKLHALVSRFADEYFLHAAWQLKSTKSSGALKDDFPPPSRKELTRLQRAFFRFELYCRLFPPTSGFGSISIQPQSQLRLFVERLSLWEVEEMSCAHNYLSRLISEVVDDLQEQVVLEVLGSPGAQVSSEARPYDPKTQERYASGIATWGRKLDGSPAPVRRHPHPPDRTVVPRQSVDAITAPPPVPPRGSTLSRQRLFDFDDSQIGTVASAGLGHTEDLVNGDDEQRRVLIHKHVRHRLAFAEVLKYSPPADPGHPNIPDGVSSNDPYQPNLGYRLYKRQGPNKFHGIYSEGNGGMRNFVYSPLRERGYVFWDSERVGIRRVAWRLKQASNVSLRTIRTMFRYKVRSVPERIKGIMVRAVEERRIIDRFANHHSSRQGGQFRPVLRA